MDLASKENRHPAWLHLFGVAQLATSVLTPEKKNASLRNSAWVSHSCCYLHYLQTWTDWDFGGFKHVLLSVQSQLSQHSLTPGEDLSLVVKSQTVTRTSLNVNDELFLDRLKVLWRKDSAIFWSFSFFNRHCVLTPKVHLSSSWESHCVIRSTRDLLNVNVVERRDYYWSRLVLLIVHISQLTLETISPCINTGASTRVKIKSNSLLDFLLLLNLLFLYYFMFLLFLLFLVLVILKSLHILLLLNLFLNQLLLQVSQVNANPVYSVLHFSHRVVLLLELQLSQRFYH